jgi:hypothetical protein
MMVYNFGMTFLLWQGGQHAKRTEGCSYEEVLR